MVAATASTRGRAAAKLTDGLPHPSIPCKTDAAVQLPIRLIKTEFSPRGFGLMLGVAHHTRRGAIHPFPFSQSTSSEALHSIALQLIWNDWDCRQWKASRVQEKHP